MNDEEKYRKILAMSESFWNRVDKSGPDNCWPWLGYTDQKGYGRLRFINTHRAAWILTNGRMITSEEQVLHHCDNPPCCNPKHLFLGDHDINMADMVSKGRQSKGEKSSTAVKAGLRRLKERDPELYIQRRCEHHRGVNHPLVKLSEGEVRMIRTCEGTQKEIAMRFGISFQTVSDIRRGKRWKHIT